MMFFLRNWWRRGAVYQYFADMAPIDRATAYIVLGLIFALAFSVTALTGHS